MFNKKINNYINEKQLDKTVTGKTNELHMFVKKTVKTVTKINKQEVFVD